MEFSEKNFSKLSEILLVGQSQTQVQPETNCYNTRLLKIKNIFADALVIKNEISEKQNEINSLKLENQKKQNQNSDLMYEIQSLTRKVDRIEKDAELLKSQLAETIQDRALFKKQNLELTENLAMQHEKLKTSITEQFEDAKKHKSQVNDLISFFSCSYFFKIRIQNISSRQSSF